MPRKKKSPLRMGRRETTEKETEVETEDKSEKSEEKVEDIIEKKAKEDKDEIKKEEPEKESKKKEVKEEKTDKELEEKKKKLKERAQALAEKLGEKEDKGDLAEYVREKKAKGEKIDMLVPLDDYVKCGIHLGTKVIMPWMKQYVYRRRADGLAVLNTEVIDKKIREAIPFLTSFDAKDIILVCKREAGWKPAIVFSEVTGIRAFTKKYPAGIMTNPILENFFEPELVIICDPWIDKNALHDAKITGKKLLGLCDANNVIKDIDVIIPCNNKSEKSIGLVFYILAREFLKAKGIKKEIKLEDFVKV